MVVFVHGLHAHDDVAIHLNKAAIAVVGEGFVAGFCGEGFDGFIVEAEVEDGVHHAGHGFACTGTNGKEEGVFVGTQFFAELFFDGGDRGF